MSKYNWCSFIRHIFKNDEFKKFQFKKAERILELCGIWHFYDVQLLLLTFFSSFATLAQKGNELEGSNLAKIFYEAFSFRSERILSMFSYLNKKQKKKLLEEKFNKLSFISIKFIVRLKRINKSMSFLNIHKISIMSITCANIRIFNNKSKAIWKL